jgi:Flp pilus assembly protein TadG
MYRNWPARFRRVKRRTAGVAATELALILPLVITIVLACIDFGRFGAAYIAITNAARAGAGVGSNSKVSTGTMGIWRTKIREAVNNEFAGQTGVAANRLSVPDPQLITEASGLRRVRVETQYNFQMLVPWPGLPSQMTLRRAVEMRMIF